jgi:thiamine biosynthesis lipoprotein
MISRARPLLGTFVSIRAGGSDEDVRAAFAAVEQVHRLMSFHSGRGDLARINRVAFLEDVEVHPWTMEVLSHAIGVSKESNGAFDITQGRAGATWRDVELLQGNRVRLRRQTMLDLGGIAKGYAVDKAIEALEARGVRRASVNAGGDLRFLGDVEEVGIRGAGLAWISLLKERSIATSNAGGGWTVSVLAHACVLADALTKAVAAGGPLKRLLGRFDARAFAMDPGGVLHAPAA